MQVNRSVSTLNLEDQIILICCRQRFESSHQDQLLDISHAQKVNWEVVFQTSRLHGVAPLVYWNLSKLGFEKLGVPEFTKLDFKTAYQRNVTIRRDSEENLEQVLEISSRYPLAVMLVKGEALVHLVYWHPWLVSMADMDILFKPAADQKELPFRAQLVEALEELNRRSSQGSEHIEYDFNIHHDITMNGILRVDENFIWGDAQKIQLGNHFVYMMSPEHTLIATAINACRKRYFKLKSLFDLVEIIQAYPNLKWETVIEQSITYRCNMIVFTALCVAKMTLGCSCSETILDLMGVNPLRKWFIRRLIAELIKNYSLLELINRMDRKILGRKLSLTLLLTYATYHWEQVLRKLVEIYKNRNNPHGWDPANI